MPIFTRSYDLLMWLLEVTRHFPKANRHDFTKRLLDAGFDLRERFEEANLACGAQRLNRLNLADESLAKVHHFPPEIFLGHVAQGTRSMAKPIPGCALSVVLGKYS